MAYKRLLTIILAVTFLIAAPAQVFAQRGDDAAAITQQITDTYSKAKSRADVGSFAGKCALYVNNQLYILGINRKYVYGNGNDEYDNYRNLKESNGGRGINAYPASKYGIREALCAITRDGKRDAYNILVGFNKTATKAGSVYGHVFFIHAILGGTVYYSECYDTPYAKEGAPITCSIDELAERYSSANKYVLDGIIHFYDYPEVKRVAGADRYETAAANLRELRGVLGLGGFDKIIVACGENFPDALSGSYLSSRFLAPILLVGKEREDGRIPGLSLLLDTIESELLADGRVYILGGTASVSQTVQDEIAKVIGGGADAVERIAGDDRFDTNMAVLGLAGLTDKKELVVCDGRGFADALSASAAGRPILLVDRDAAQLTEAQTQFITEGGFKKVYIMGGTAAVPGALEEQIAACCGCEVARVSAGDRYGTSKAAADTFFPGSAPPAPIIPTGLPAGCWRVFSARRWCSPQVRTPSSPR